MMDCRATPALIMLTSMVSHRFTRCGGRVAIAMSVLLTAGTLAAPGATAASAGGLDRHALQESLEAADGARGLP